MSQQSFAAWSVASAVVWGAFFYPPPRVPAPSDPTQGNPARQASATSAPTVTPQLQSAAGKRAEAFAKPPAAPAEPASPALPERGSSSPKASTT